VVVAAVLALLFLGDGNDGDGGGGLAAPRTPDGAVRLLETPTPTARTPRHRHAGSPRPHAGPPTPLALTPPAATPPVPPAPTGGAQRGRPRRSAAGEQYGVRFGGQVLGGG
jgi:hypothetical protein